MHAMYLFFFVCRAQYYTYVANINTLLYIYFCLLFFGLMYSTMPDCIEHLLDFSLFIVRYYTACYSTGCAVGSTMVCLLLGCGDLGIYGAALQPVGLCGNMLTAGVSSCCGVQNLVHVYSIYN